jgi:hypothetical protein
MAKVIGMVNILLCKADKFKWLKIWSWLAARLEYKRGGGGGGGGGGGVYDHCVIHCHAPIRKIAFSYYIFKVYSCSWLVKTRRIILGILKPSRYFSCWRHQRRAMILFLTEIQSKKKGLLPIIARCGYQAPATKWLCILSSFWIYNKTIIDNTSAPRTPFTDLKALFSLLCI